MASTRNTKITAQLTNLSTTEEGKIVTADSIAVISLVNAAGEYTEIKRVTFGDLDIDRDDLSTIYADVLNDLVQDITPAMGLWVAVSRTKGTRLEYVAPEIVIDSDGTPQFFWNIVPDIATIAFRVTNVRYNENDEEYFNNESVVTFCKTRFSDEEDPETRSFALAELALDDSDESKFADQVLDALAEIVDEMAAEVDMDADRAGNDSGLVIWNLRAK